MSADGQSMTVPGPHGNITVYAGCDPWLDERNGMFEKFMLLCHIEEWAAGKDEKPE